LQLRIAAVFFATDDRKTMPNKKMVLLVDDNEADNVYHEIILRRSGRVAAVATKDSAAAALEYLRAQGQSWPHVILVDVNMPGMDGFAFIQQLEALSPPDTCKVAMLTSSDADQDHRRASELKLISAYFIKPLTLTAVAHMLI